MVTHLEQNSIFNDDNFKAKVAVSVMAKINALAAFESTLTTRQRKWSTSITTDAHIGHIARLVIEKNKALTKPQILALTNGELDTDVSDIVDFLLTGA